MSHVIVSDSREHNKTSIVVFTNKLLELKLKGVKHVKIWTDGPKSQFKNKYVMYSMQMLSDKHNAHISWNFSVTNHRKGPVDVIGATLKRVADEKVQRRQCVINGVEDFYEAVKGGKVQVTMITERVLAKLAYNLQTAARRSI